jgi:hypothetical protein
LVAIKMTGESKKDPGHQLASEGTGFFVTSDGYILTAFHLFYNENDPPIPESVSILVSKETKDSAPQKAFLVNALPYVDIALLKTPSATNPYPAATLGSSQDLQFGKKMSTQGFSLNSIGPPQVQPMPLSSFDGPGGFTMLASAVVDGGQSGSPIYLENGNVIGIVKGTVGAQTAFIPIDFAEALLASGHKADLQAKYTDLEKRFGELNLAYKDLEKRLDDLTSPTAFTKRIDDESAKYFSSDDGRGVLTAWLRNYIHGGATELDSEIDAYLHNLVAYSYNDTFSLATQGGPRAHVLPFYKVDGDHGDLSCEATYPANPDKKPYPNRIFYSFNDNPTIFEIRLPPTRSGSIVKKFDTLPSDNSALYDPARPGSTLSPYQTINFAIEDKTPMSDSVTVQCTIIIIGSAKYRGK